MKHSQAPSPTSAIMNISHSLDAYLEPNRLSFSSPPASELIQQGHSSDESYPVFSPLPASRKQSLQSNVLVPIVPATTSATGTTTTTSSNTLQPGTFVRQHRRQSSINTVSFTDQGETSSGRIRQISTNLDPSHVSCFSLFHTRGVQHLINMIENYHRKETEDENGVTLRRRPSHRRQSSVGISFYRSEEQHSSHRRRFSYASSSWMRDADDEDEPDEISTRTGRGRPYSWGPIGDFFYRDSLSFCESDRSPFSHQECNSL